MNKNKKKLNIVGVAGEYFVAAELSQRGVVATLTLKNTPYIDILATNLETGKSANVQVKTMSVENKAGWHLNPRDGEPSGIANHFYVLVDLQGSGKLPNYIIIPKPVFSKFLKSDYEKWITGKKKDGSPRKRTNMWIFDPHRRSDLKNFSRKYENNWDILDLW